MALFGGSKGRVRALGAPAEPSAENGETNGETSEQWPGYSFHRYGRRESFDNLPP